MPQQHMLYWSKRGDVACTVHAPSPDDPEWTAKGWRPVQRESKRIVYQCQQCEGSPLRHPPSHYTPIARSAGYDVTAPPLDREPSTRDREPTPIPAPPPVPATRKPDAVCWRFIGDAGRAVECLLQYEQHVVSISVRYGQQTIRSEIATTLQAARETADRWRRVMRRQSAFTEVNGPWIEEVPGSCNPRAPISDAPAAYSECRSRRLER